MFARRKKLAGGRTKVQIVRSVRNGDRVRQRVLRHVGTATSEAQLERPEGLARLIIEEIRRKDSGRPRDHDAHFGRVVSMPETGGKTTVKTRYFIPSLPLGAGRFAYAVRSHWGIGNRPHWVPAVTFRDDDSRVRKDGAPKNFAVMKHMAMNLPTGRRSANP